MLKINYVAKVNIVLNVMILIQIVALHVLHLITLKMMGLVLRCLVCLLQVVYLACMLI